MENKIKSPFKEEIDELGYREAIVAHGDVKVCVYRGEQPFCYIGVEKASLGFRKREEPTNEQIA